MTGNLARSYRVLLLAYPGWYRPPVVVEQVPANLPPPQQYWYYCETSAQYYPYVTSCAVQWKPVPVQPPQ